MHVARYFNPALQLCKLNAYAKVVRGGEDNDFQWCEI